MTLPPMLAVEVRPLKVISHFCVGLNQLLDVLVLELRQRFGKINPNSRFRQLVLKGEKHQEELRLPLVEKFHHY